MRFQIYKNASFTFPWVLKGPIVYAASVGRFYRCCSSFAEAVEEMRQHMLANAAYAATPAQIKRTGYW